MDFIVDILHRIISLHDNCNNLDPDLRAIKLSTNCFARQALVARLQVASTITSENILNTLRLNKCLPLIEISIPCNLGEKALEPDAPKTLHQSEWRTAGATRTMWDYDPEQRLCVLHSHSTILIGSRTSLSPHSSQKIEAMQEPKTVVASWPGREEGMVGAGRYAHHVTY